MPKLLLLILLLAASAAGQTSGAASISLWPGVPAGSCNPRTLGINQANGNLYTCFSSAYQIVSGGGGGWNPPNAPGDTIFGNNTVSVSVPSFFTPGGDVSFSSGNFSVNALHFGPTALTLTNTGIATGNCLTVSGSNLIGSPCGTGGGGGGTVTSVTASSLPPLFTTTVGNATTTPGITFTLTNQNPDQLFGVNASGIPYYFTPSGDVIFHGGAFTVTDLHFGLTSLPLSTTTPTSGQYLMYDGTNIVGATAPGGGGGLTGCSTPTSGNLTCDNSVAVTAASVGVMTLGLGSLPQPPAGASGALAANASGVLYWSPGSGAAFTPVTTAPTGAANSLTFGANPTIALATTNPTNGECLLFNGTNITGGPCGTSAVSGPIGGVVAVQ